MSREFKKLRKLLCKIYLHQDWTDMKITFKEIHSIENDMYGGFVTGLYELECKHCGKKFEKKIAHMFTNGRYRINGIPDNKEDAIENAKNYTNRPYRG